MAGVILAMDQEAPESNTCIGCGCTDWAACLVNGLPCHWVLLDEAAQRGVCSGCREHSDRFRAGDYTIERKAT